MQTRWDHQGVTVYRRPDVDQPVLHGPDGAVIAYGRRWGAASPPEDTYSVVSHPERFAPLHAVADALVAFLADAYEVGVRALGPAEIAASFPGADVARAVRVSPSREDAAPLVVGLTRFPGVALRAGARYDEPVPQCGCDACDESFESAADALERTVLAVAEGRFSEEVVGSRYRHTITDTDGVGWSSGEQLMGRAERQSPAVRLLARRRARHWQPWPRHV